MQRAEALANRKEASPQEFNTDTASAYNRKPLVSHILDYVLTLAIRRQERLPASDRMRAARFFVLPFNG